MRQGAGGGGMRRTTRSAGSVSASATAAATRGAVVCAGAPSPALPAFSACACRWMRAWSAAMAAKTEARKEDGG